MVVALHKNQISGRLEHTHKLKDLCVLTIFDNSLTGRLILPPMKSCEDVPPVTVFVPTPFGTVEKVLLEFKLHTSSPLLYAQSNRLSCNVQGNSSAFLQENKSSLLVAPGNQLSLTHEFASNMSSASFMWAPKTLDQDHWAFPYLIFGGAGLLVLAVLIPTLRRGRSHCDAVDTWHVFEKTMLASARLLMPIVLLACTLVCWYWSAAHLYDCGDPILKLTLGYLDEDARKNMALGWKAATASFFFSVANIYLVQGFRIRMSTLYPKVEHTQYTNSINTGPDTNFRATASLGAQAAWFMLYSFLVAVCCVVPFLNVVADYVPQNPDAVQSWIRPISPFARYIKHSAGVFLHIISNMVIPFAARKLAGSPTAAVRWMIFGRLVINQLSTAVFTVLLDEECLAGWLHYIFKDCEVKDSFLVSGDATVNPHYIGMFTIPLKITRHTDICGGAEMFRGGRCLQSLTSNISKLLISKLIVTAFVAPCFYLVFCLLYSKLPCVQLLLGWLMSRLRSCVHTCCPRLSDCVPTTPPEKSVSLDTELISFIMLLEMSIVYGLTAPVIPALCLCAVLTHLAVFYASRVHLQACFCHDVKPATNYLVFSLVLGSTLNIAYFWGSADSSSKIFLTVSCTGAVVGYLGQLKTEGRQAACKTGLLAPLIDPEGKSCPSSTNDLVHDGKLSSSGS